MTFTVGTPAHENLQDGWLTVDKNPATKFAGSLRTGNHNFHVIMPHWYFCKAQTFLKYQTERRRETPLQPLWHPEHFNPKSKSRFWHFKSEMSVAKCLISNSQSVLQYKKGKESIVKKYSCLSQIPQINQRYIREKLDRYPHTYTPRNWSDLVWLVGRWGGGRG